MKKRIMLLIFAMCISLCACGESKVVEEVEVSSEPQELTLMEKIKQAKSLGELYDYRRDAESEEEKNAIII